MKEKLKALIGLFSLFFKIGLVTFGGGIAMLPILEREIVGKRKWATAEELLDWFAIGQSTPGIIAVNVATFTGHKRAGALGGIVATAGMVCPSIIVITVIATFISNFKELVWVQKALLGINVSVAAILTYAVATFAKKSVKGAFGFALLLVAFALIYVCNVGTIWVILGSAVLGIVLAALRGGLAARGTEECAHD